MATILTKNGMVVPSSLDVPDLDVPDRDGHSRPPNHTQTLTLMRTEDGRIVECGLSGEVVEGPGRGAKFESSDSRAVLGASSDCDWVCPHDPGVSRRHAELRAVSGGLLVTDLGSKNGTWVEGVRVSEALLPSGSTIILGATELRISVVAKALRHSPENPESPESPGRHASDLALFEFGGFVTEHPPLAQTLALLRRAAATDSTVLIEGATGTGKEGLARAVHDHSRRHEGPYVIVDCGAVTASLTESELFGHIKGAFTGAVADRPGALTAAAGGTVFLDEIGELPLELQPKLLRALESRTVRPVGSPNDVRIDVRFIAATNRSLRDMVAEKTFRSDLYYRLAVIEVAVPPLSERPEDVPLLASRFVAQQSDGRHSLTPAALTTLTQYDWPGNVRELRNVIERATAVARTPAIEPSDLFARPISPAPIEATSSFHAAKEALIASFEKRFIEGLLKRHEGNVSRAAREACLSRNALYELMKRVGIQA
ncbi:MAG: sigma 54-dependent Fis family transcriptional regulator [Deltaproteobacteria bacterium]|nr:sigma 54-dependent Fis family transcriptional regulator [Deltaproteobacteria bacterium]